MTVIALCIAGFTYSAPGVTNFPESGDPFSIGSRTSGDVAVSVMPADSGADSSGPDSAPLDAFVVARGVPGPDSCRQARRALHWYVQKAREWWRRMGRAVDSINAEARPSCPKWLAKQWQAKARAARHAFERWHAYHWDWRAWL